VCTWFQSHKLCLVSAHQFYALQPLRFALSPIELGQKPVSHSSSSRSTVVASKPVTAVVSPCQALIVLGELFNAHAAVPVCVRLPDRITQKLACMAITHTNAGVWFACCQASLVRV
jgi:hypothetical protein